MDDDDLRSLIAKLGVEGAAKIARIVELLAMLPRPRSRPEDEVAAALRTLNNAELLVFSDLGVALPPEVAGRVAVAPLACFFETPMAIAAARPS